MNGCYHDRFEPVTLSTGEIVAVVCADCLAGLPINWGCEQCDWVDVSTLADLIPRRIPGMPCRDHIGLMMGGVGA